MSDPVACHVCGGVGPAFWVDEKDSQGRVICSTCDSWPFTWKDVDVLTIAVDRMEDAIPLNAAGRRRRIALARSAVKRLAERLPPREG